MTLDRLLSVLLLRTPGGMTSDRLLSVLLLGTPGRPPSSVPTMSKARTRSRCGARLCAGSPFGRRAAGGGCGVAAGSAGLSSCARCPAPHARGRSLRAAP